MIGTGLEPTDLAAMFESESWKWFKALCAKNAQAKLEQILGSNPSDAAWAISKAQGYYEAMSAIAEGIDTMSGHISFETFMLDELHDQITGS